MGSKRVLIAPLDWGLGHAARCIPVIRALIRSGHDVLIAADGKGEQLLKEEFPELPFLHLRGYRLSYSRLLPAWLKTFFMIPKIALRILQEHRALKKIISSHKINIVISDNRFGLWNKKIASVYITHQVMIKCPSGLKIFEPLLYAFHLWIIKKYSWCWIPDYEGPSNLSGELSHKYPLPPNARFIFPLSRFVPIIWDENANYEYELCILLSGPEPSRTALEKKMMSLLRHYRGTAIFIQGLPGEKKDMRDGKHRIVSHLPTDGLFKAIISSRFVICRAGYSSIMDMVTLGKDAMLIPTPGQTEQEYLADLLSSKKIFSASTESAFDFQVAFTKQGFSVNNLLRGPESSPLYGAIRQLTDSA